MLEKRTATLNVPCTGKFTLAMYSDFTYTVQLDDTMGQHHELTDPQESVFDMVVLTSNDQFAFDLPTWMWDCLSDKLDELKISFECDSIHIPHTVGTA